jgi:hypothetical protein
MFNFFKKKALEQSEKELESFANVFTDSDSDNVEFIWRAVVFNYQMSKKDLDWSTALGSDQGHNMGLCSTYVIKTNGFINDLHKAGRVEDLVGMKIWNMTFRAMSNPSFHHYGVSIWEEIVGCQDFVRTIAAGLVSSLEITKGEEVASVKELRSALNLIEYVPPQFKSYLN